MVPANSYDVEYASVVSFRGGLLLSIISSLTSMVHQRVQVTFKMSSRAHLVCLLYTTADLLAVSPAECGFIGKRASFYFGSFWE